MDSLFQDLGINENTPLAALTCGQYVALERALQTAPSAAGQGDWLFSDSPGVPVGRRTFGVIVRDGIATGKPGFAKIGRRFAMTRAALDAALERLSREPQAKTSTPDAADRLRAELGGAL